jgi:hypothetical protein
VAPGLTQIHEALELSSYLREVHESPVLLYPQQSWTPNMQAFQRDTLSRPTLTARLLPASEALHAGARAASTQQARRRFLGAEPVVVIRPAVVYPASRRRFACRRFVVASSLILLRRCRVRGRASA